MENNKSAFERLKAKVTERHRDAAKQELDRLEVAYKWKFPSTIHDFTSLARPIDRDELTSSEKEGLIDLVIALKYVELERDISYNELVNKLDKLIGTWEQELDLYGGTGNVRAHAVTEKHLEEIYKIFE